jgi:hypothetical protein
MIQKKKKKKKIEKFAQCPDDVNVDAYTYYYYYHKSPVFQVLINPFNYDSIDGIINLNSYTDLIKNNWMNIIEYI